MNKILVTGGLGFIGHHLLKLLSGMNYEIIVIDKLVNKGHTFQAPDNITFYNSDILDTNALLDIFSRERIDTCIHLAAKTCVLNSILYPHDTLDVNVKGTLNLLEACSKQSVRRFVFASSSAVYGESKQLPVKEDHPLDPISPYAASKAAAEALVSTYGNLRKIEHTISLRFFNVFGKGQSPYDGVIAIFLERLSMGLAPIIYGDGKQTRDFVSVSDAVTAILLAMKLENGLSRTNVFNIATGRSVTIKDLADIMIRISGLRLEPVYEPDRMGDIRFVKADITKSRNILGFCVSRSLESELESLVTCAISKANQAK